MHAVERLVPPVLIPLVEVTKGFLTNQRSLFWKKEVLQLSLCLLGEITGQRKLTCAELLEMLVSRQGLFITLDMSSHFNEIPLCPGESGIQ